MNIRSKEAICLSRCPKVMNKNPVKRNAEADKELECQLFPVHWL